MTTPSSDSPNLATFEYKLESLNTAISALTASVEKNNEKLERLAVLEVSHRNSDEAIDRAFTAIREVKDSVISLAASNTTEHKTYDKWLYIAIGFCVAVSTMWTLVGYRVNTLIDEQVKVTAEMKLHIHDDKIKSLEDVQRVPPLRERP